MSKYNKYDYPAADEIQFKYNVKKKRESVNVFDHNSIRLKISERNTNNNTYFKLKIYPIGLNKDASGKKMNESVTVQ